VRIVSPDDIAHILTYPALIDALDEAFHSDIAQPVRHHHTIPRPGGNATLLLMPAWTESGQQFLGCKVLTVFPGDAARDVPLLHGTYLLMSGETGDPLAVIDGRALTAWRTACASALAARYLAREDASHLVMVGAGVLAPHLIRAHMSVRPVTRVTLWNRTRGHAVQTAFALAASGIEVDVDDDLEAVVKDADIVSCATLSTEPLIRGHWLKRGAHLDLVGGRTPKMREADDAALKLARVYVDTRAGAYKEAGDIVQPMRRKVIARSDIQGDLFDLCRGKKRGRGRKDEITLFKSVGTAIEDLAAAMLVWQRLNA